MAKTDEEKVVRGSGNVFQDLDVDEAPAMLAKAELVYAIKQTLEDRGLTQSAAAMIMGIDQPKVSSLLRGQFRGFSSDRLMHFLTLLGQDVKIVIAPHSPVSPDPARVSVSIASSL